MTDQRGEEMKGKGAQDEPVIAEELLVMSILNECPERNEARGEHKLDP